MKRNPQRVSYLTTLARWVGHKIKRRCSWIGWHIRTVIEVSEAPLRTKNEQPANGGIGYDGKSAQIPHHGVTNKVYLAVVFHPEILIDNVSARCPGRYMHTYYTAAK